MKVVGQSLPKIDALPIATGQPVYTEDLAPSQALVVKVLHSPHAFARLRQVDVSLALKVPGVACVLTHQDVPQERFTLAGQSYPEPSPYDRRILDEYVRYVGDAVAIVAAVDEKTAEKALQLIRVEYEVLEPVLDFETAARHASVVHPEDNVLCNFPIGMEKEKNIICTHKNEYGDVEAELAQCPVVVEETYYTQAQAHGMMELVPKHHLNQRDCAKKDGAQVIVPLVESQCLTVISSAEEATIVAQSCVRKRLDVG